MPLTIGGGQRLPSLVEAALEQRLDNWREWDAKRPVRIARRRAAGGKRKQIPESVIQAVRAARSEGMAIKALARRFHLDRVTVRNILKKGE